MGTIIAPSRQHTPGPWLYESAEDGRSFDIQQVARKDPPIAKVAATPEWGNWSPGVAQGAANARLIAASPRFAEAALKTRRFLEALEAAGMKSGDGVAALEATRAALEAAGVQ